MPLARLPLDQYLVLDARRLEERIPNRSFIDLTITSPPYWNLKDYGTSAQIGFGQNYNDYLQDVEDVFRAVFERTKQSGSLWIVADTLKQRGDMELLPFDIAARLRGIGWKLQDVIIWQKDRTLPWSHQGKLRNIFEYILFFSKTSAFKFHVTRVRDLSDLKYYWVKYPERYSPDGKTPSRTWTFAIPRQGSWGTAANYVRHACPLPIGLVERIVALSSDRGDTVFDPFAGSGTTLAVAAATGRHFLGTDLSKTYRKLFTTKVLPSIKSRLSGTTDKDLIRARAERLSFRRKIMALRTLKFPKELVRLYLRKHKDVRASAMIVTPGVKEGAIGLLWVICAGPANSRNVATRAKALAMRAPLSKYGLHPTIKVIRASSLDDTHLNAMGIRPTTRVCVYSAGRFYRWSSQTTGKGLVSQVHSEIKPGPYPLIFSTVRVRLDPSHPELFGQSHEISNGQKKEAP